MHHGEGSGWLRKSILRVLRQGSPDLERLLPLTYAHNDLGGEGLSKVVSWRG